MPVLLLLPVFVSEDALLLSKERAREVPSLALYYHSDYQGKVVTILV